VRYVKHDPTQVKLLLATDRAAVRPLLAHLRAKFINREHATIKLPLHPGSEAVRTSFDLPFEPKMSTWQAAMIKILDEDNPAIREYCQQVSSRRRKPGLVIWPPCFEFA
jgi:hypothetical protein